MADKVKTGTLVKDRRGGLSIVSHVNASSGMAYLLELKKGIKWNHFAKNKWCIHKNAICDSPSIFVIRQIKGHKLIQLLYGA